MANDKAELIGFTLMFVLGAALIVVASSAMSDSDQISYQTNGGTLSNAPTTYDPGEELDLPDPVRDGWVFAGWYLDSGLTVEFNGDTTGMSGKLVLYAAWETDKTGLKLVLTKSGSYVSGFTRYTVSGEYSATYLCYNREMGQYYLYIEDETTYKPIIGSATKNSSSDYQWENDGDDDMVLYGHATISTINGDVYCEVYRSISGEEVQWIGVNDGILYQATYKTGSSLFSTTSADITYKLTSVEQVTVEPSLTITLTTDDGISVEGLKDLYVPGETVKLTAVLDKDVEFRGWFVDGVYGSSKETISFQLTRDITLQAKAKHYYSISYDLNDGTVEGTLPDTYATGDTLTLPTPTNGDLIFEGWYLDEDFDEQFTGDTSDLERDITLYAAWSENLSGHYITLTKSGTNERGYNSYDISGDLTFTYLYYNTDKGSYFIRNTDNTTYDYKYMKQSYSESTSNMYWSSEIEGTWENIGTETLSVKIDGIVVEKECSINRLTYTNGATETQWIGDGWIPYKIEYYYNYSYFMFNYYVDIVYEYLEDGVVEIENDCTITVIAGEGITVTGNNSPYMLGQTVELVATISSDAIFGGWYDENMTLLSKNTTYTFVVGGSQTIYAMNSDEYDKKLESDVLLDLNEIFGLNDAEFTITNEDTGDVDTVKGEEYTFDNGGVYTIVAKDTDGTNKLYTVMVTGNVERTYTWTYDNKDYTYTMEIDYEDLLYSRSIYTVSQRCQQSGHDRDKTFVTYSFTDDRMSPYTETLTSGLIDLYKENHSSVTEIGWLGFVLSFTQYIEYQTDEEYMGTEEYWKFPLETLYDQGGDCEDTSILFASIALKSKAELGFSYNVALQLLPGHMCGAVKLKSTTTSYTTNPSGYIYCETTTTDYAIGQIPTQMKSYFTSQTYYNSGYSATVEVTI